MGEIAIKQAITVMCDKCYRIRKEQRAMDQITASLRNSRGLLGEGLAKFETRRMELGRAERRKVSLVKETPRVKAQR